MNLRFIFIFTGLVLCALETKGQTFELFSPDAKNNIKVSISPDSVTYQLYRESTPLSMPAHLGLKIDGKQLCSRAKFLRVVFDTTRQVLRPIVAQKMQTIADNYNQLTCSFESFSIIFRAYNNGIAYRFETFSNKNAIINEETIQLALMPTDTVLLHEEESFFSANERFYKKYAATDVNKHVGSLPLLVEKPSGLKLLMTESDVHHYPIMWVSGSQNKPILRGVFPNYVETEKVKNEHDIVPEKRAGYIAETNTMRTLPWRIFAIAANDADLLTNTLVTQLAEKARLADNTWIKPGKTAWDNWNAYNITNVAFKVGANTDTYKHYIDFAARNGMKYILIDENWAKKDNILEEASDVNIRDVCEYGQRKGVKVVLTVAWSALNKDITATFDSYFLWGVGGVKVDFMQRNDQKIVEFCWKVAEEAANKKLLVSFSGGLIPNGLSTTFPNVITSEGVAGLEQAKTDKKIDPEHNLILPFTRQVVGAMDYTPGAMTNANKADFVASEVRPMSLGTRCHQLGMYVVYESPLQTLADAPSVYRREDDCMEFLTVVPTVWDTTIVLDTKLGDYIVLARKSLDEEWFVGGMTDWTAREFDINFDFLPENTQFEAIIWQDGINTDRNASDYNMTTRTIRKGDVVKIKMASGGGFVMRLIKV